MRTVGLRPYPRARRGTRHGQVNESGSPQAESAEAVPDTPHGFDPRRVRPKFAPERADHDINDVAPAVVAAAPDPIEKLDPRHCVAASAVENVERAKFER